VLDFDRRPRVYSFAGTKAKSEANSIALNEHLLLEHQKTVAGAPRAISVKVMHRICADQGRETKYSQVAERESLAIGGREGSLLTR
jgi:hypothetical protein